VEYRSDFQFYSRLAVLCRDFRRPKVTCLSIL